MVLSTCTQKYTHHTYHVPYIHKTHPTYN